MIILGHVGALLHMLTLGNRLIEASQYGVLSITVASIVEIHALALQGFQLDGTHHFPSFCTSACPGACRFHWP